MMRLSGYFMRFIRRLRNDCLDLLGEFISMVGRAKCNICGWEGKTFDDIDCGFGLIEKRTKCPSCQSNTRHRCFHAYFKKVLPRDKRLKLLHFAPEKCLTEFFRTYANIEYLSVDIRKGFAMREEDITALTFGDSAFDVILCSHVLEHVEDDQKALMEMYRVLKPGGLAIIDVPIDISRRDTYEDRNIVSPEARTKAFWGRDHLRLYGKDFPDRLRRAGFKVIVDSSCLSPGMIKVKYHGLGIHPLYCCVKENAGGTAAEK